MIAATGAFTLMAGSVLAQGVGESWRFGCGPNMMGWGWGGMIVMPLFMIAVLAAVAVFIAALLRWLVGPNRTPSNHAAIEILGERFARGEIEQREYDERRRVLGG